MVANIMSDSLKKRFDYYCKKFGFPSSENGDSGIDNRWIGESKNIFLGELTPSDAKWPPERPKEYRLEFELKTKRRRFQRGIRTSIKGTGNFIPITNNKSDQNGAPIKVKVHGLLASQTLVVTYISVDNDPLVNSYIGTSVLRHNGQNLQGHSIGVTTAIDLRAIAEVKLTKTSL